MVKHAKSLITHKKFARSERQRSSGSRMRHLRCCKVCEERGSLQECEICEESFHLACLGIFEEVDLAWHCPDCTEAWESRFSEEACKLVHKQDKAKEAFVRKTLNKLVSVGKDKQMSEFAELYPYYVQHGHIVYPIEDSLIAAEPVFHNARVTERPKPQESSLEGLPDLIAICDFVYNFREYFALEPLSTESLHAALKTDSEMSVKVHFALICPLAIAAFKKDQLVKTYFDGLGSLLSKVKKICNLKDLIRSCYLLFFEYVLFNPRSDHLISELQLSELLGKVEDFPLTSYYSSQYSIGEKARLLSTLIPLHLASPALKEEIERKTVLQSQLFSRRKSLQVKFKQMKTSKKHFKRILLPEHIALKQEIEDLSKQMKLNNSRTEYIGKDRDMNEYYFFQWDLRCLWMKTQSDKWGFYPDKAAIRALSHALCNRGIREGKLINSIEKIMGYMTEFNAENDTTSSECESVSTVNIFAETKHKLIEIKELLKDNFVTKVELETIDINNAENISDLADILHLLHDSPTQLKYKIASEKIYKCRKVEIVMWEVHGDLYFHWKHYLESYSCLLDLYILTEIFFKLLKDYLSSVQILQEEEVPPPEEKKVVRRSGRLLELRSNSHYVYYNDDYLCFVCGQEGFLICCDLCPKLAHLSCVGLEDVPPDDWYCDECKEKQLNTRMTRRKTKIVNSTG